MHKEALSHILLTCGRIVTLGPCGRADFSSSKPESTTNQGENTQDLSQLKNLWNENNSTQQSHMLITAIIWHQL